MNNPPYDLALIDDDELIQATWKMCANVKGHRLLCVRNENDFLNSNVSRDVPVYIDFHLSGERNGFEIAKILHSNGYRRIFIATGSNITEAPEEIQKIVGKDYPL